MTTYFQTPTHFLRYENKEIFSVIDLNQMKFEANPKPVIEEMSKKEISEAEYWNMVHAVRTIQNEVNAKFYE